MPSGKKHIRYRPVKNRKKTPAGGLRYGPVFTGCPAVELAVERLYQADDAGREERFWGLVKALNYAMQVQTRVLVPVQLTPEGSQSQFSWASDPIPPEKAKGLALWTLHTPKGYKVLPAFTKPDEADASPATLGLPMAALVVALCALLLGVMDWLIHSKNLFQRLDRTVALRYAGYFLLAAAILLFGSYGEGYDPQAFVYFQF